MGRWQAHSPKKSEQNLHWRQEWASTAINGIDINDTKLQHWEEQYHRHEFLVCGVVELDTEARGLSHRARFTTESAAPSRAEDGDLLLKCRR